MASNLSSFTASPQTIAVTDCARAVCEPNGRAAQSIISRVFAPIDGISLDSGLISPRELNEIVTLLRSPSNSSVYKVRMLPMDLVNNVSAFQRTDVSTFDSYSNATISSDPTPGNWTTFPGYERNRDITLTGAPSGTRMRPFGFFFSIQFPDGVGRVRITANTAAGVNARTVIVNVGEDDAPCLNFLAPFCDSSQLYGGNTTSPNDPSVYSYLAPGPYGSGVLAPGSGTPELIGIAFDDLNFNQALYTFTYSAWTIWYTEELLGAIEAMASGSVPGPVSGKNLSY